MKKYFCFLGIFLAQQICAAPIENTNVTSVDVQKSTHLAIQNHINMNGVKSKKTTKTLQDSELFKQNVGQEIIITEPLPKPISPLLAS